MLKRSFLALITLLPVQAVAQFGSPNSFNVDLQVSTDGGLTWANDAVVGPGGGSVRLRAVLFADRSSLQTQVYSIAGFTLTQIDVAGADSQDSISDLWRAPSVVGDGWDISLQGDRIDRAVNPLTEPVSILQSPVASGGVTDNPWIGAGFTYNISASQPRLIELSAPSSSFTFAAAWLSTGAVSGTFPSSRCYFDGVSISVVPAPASGVLLAIAATGSTRRRR